MKGKVSEFIEYLNAQVGQAYVWGGQHLKLTPENYEAVISKKESDAVYRLQAIAYCKARFDMGAVVLYGYDCSGLGMYWLQNLKGIYKSDMNANSMMSKCEIIDKPYKGCWVFRVTDGKATHIGYMVSDTEVVYAKGRAYGVVKEQFRSSYWSCAGVPSCMEWDDPPPPTPPTPTRHKYIKVKRKCRVRDGNGTGFKTLAIAYKGNEYPLIDQDDHDPYWWIIEWNDRHAWISSNSRYTEEVTKL